MKHLIDRYLDGEMSVREQLAFEELLRDNPRLQKEFMFRKNVDEAIAEEDVMNLRDNLEEIIRGKPVNRFLRPVSLAVVAAMALLLLVAGWLFFKPQPARNGGQLFARSYEKYPSVFNARSTEEVAEQEILLRNAFAYYEQDQFNKAKEVFDSLVHTDQNNHMATFYLAISCIELGELDDAEKYLQLLVREPNQIFWEQSHWYLALVYVKQEKYAEAKKILQTIVNETLSYTAEAEEILKQLD